MAAEREGCEREDEPSRAIGPGSGPQRRSKIDHGLPIRDGHADHRGSKAETDLNLVARADGTIVEVQGTAEGAPMTREQLITILDQGLNAVRELCAKQREVLGGAWS